MVEKLLLPFRVESIPSLVLEHDDGLDKCVGFEDTNGLPAKIDNNFQFAFEAEAFIGESDRHGIRVHRLQMAGPELRMHLVKNADDLIC